MPKDVESYYQEAGRAGRDGSPSDCILLYSGKDVVTAEFLINKSFEESPLPSDEAENVRKRDMKRLRDMTFYCTSQSCLRGYILRYFGEKAPLECGGCSVCCSDSPETDVTVESQKILSCIFRAGQRYGMKMICDILRGADNEKIERAGLSSLSTCGIMKDTSERRIRLIAERLVSLGYIERTEGEYPVLKLRNEAVEVLRGNVSVTARLPGETVRKQRIEKISAVYAADPALMEILKGLRQKRAAIQGVPAYVIFTDASLRDMCEKLPRTESEFLSISGVGNAKLERYGAEFIKAICDYTAANPPGEPMLKKEELNRMKTPEDTARAVSELAAGMGNVSLTGEGLNITAFTDKIIADTGANVSASPLRKYLTDKLAEKGYLSVGTDEEGHRKISVTRLGEEAGIYYKTVTAQDGRIYKKILYSPESQRKIMEIITQTAEQRQISRI